MCEQHYHGVVKCALGWACWKTYVGRPETDSARQMAMNVLGLGLTAADHHEAALRVKEAELSMLRRLGADEDNMLVAQCNLANSYVELGRNEEALRIKQDVYSGYLKLKGEEHPKTFQAANNYVVSLNGLQRFGEAKALLRKAMPVTRRVLGDSNELTLRMSATYAMALYLDPVATLGDLREAVSMLEEAARTARRVFGGAHPYSVGMEQALRESRAALSARDGVSAVRGALEAMNAT